MPKTFVADRYHLNYSNDGPIPLDKFGPDVDFILKFSQARSYAQGAAWARGQAVRIRAEGRHVGGYHMLDGREHADGAAEADYYISVRGDLLSGDIIDWLDFERSGYSGESLAQAKIDAEAYIRRMHERGRLCGIYGHADVKAAWGDWRKSGADAYWCPGDVLHTDVGPVDLWQYDPYATRAGSRPAGYPSDGDDFSVVVTKLPLVLQPKEAFVFDARFGKGSKLRTFGRPLIVAHHVRKVLRAHRTEDGYTITVKVRKESK